MQGIPVYTVATNEHLAHIARDRICTKGGLEKVEGFGGSRMGNTPMNWLPCAMIRWERQRTATYETFWQPYAVDRIATERFSRLPKRIKRPKAKGCIQGNCYNSKLIQCVASRCGRHSPT